DLSIKLTGIIKDYSRKNFLDEDNPVQTPEDAGRRIAFAEASYSIVSGFKMKADLKIMFSLFMQGKSVGLMAGGGKTGIYLAFQGLMKSMMGAKYKGVLIVENDGAVKSFMGKDFGNGYYNQLMSAYGITMMDGNKLQGDRNNDGIGDAMSRNDQLLVIDYTTAGFINNSAVKEDANLLNRIRSGQDDRVGTVDELHLIAINKNAAVLGEQARDYLEREMRPVVDIATFLYDFRKRDAESGQDPEALFKYPTVKISAKEGALKFEPVYEMIGDKFKLDSAGNKIPVMSDGKQVQKLVSGGRNEVINYFKHGAGKNEPAIIVYQEGTEEEVFISDALERKMEFLSTGGTSIVSSVIRGLRAKEKKDYAESYDEQTQKPIVAPIGQDGSPSNNSVMNDTNYQAAIALKIVAAKYADDLDERDTQIRRDITAEATRMVRLSSSSMQVAVTDAVGSFSRKMVGASGTVTGLELLAQAHIGSSVNDINASKIELDSYEILNELKNMKSNLEAARDLFSADDSEIKLKDGKNGTDNEIEMLNNLIRKYERNEKLAKEGREGESLTKKEKEDVIFFVNLYVVSRDHFHKYEIMKEGSKEGPKEEITSKYVRSSILAISDPDLRTSLAKRFESHDLAVEFVDAAATKFDENAIDKTVKQAGRSAELTITNNYVEDTQNKVQMLETMKIEDRDDYVKKVSDFEKRKGIQRDQELNFDQILAEAREDLERAKSLNQEATERVRKLMQIQEKKQNGESINTDEQKILLSELKVITLQAKSRNEVVLKKNYAFSKPEDAEAIRLLDEAIDKQSDVERILAGGNLAESNTELTDLYQNFKIRDFKFTGKIIFADKLGWTGRDYTPIDGVHEKSVVGDQNGIDLFVYGFENMSETEFIQLTRRNLRNTKRGDRFVFFDQEQVDQRLTDFEDQSIREELISIWKIRDQDIQDAIKTGSGDVLVRLDLKKAVEKLKKIGELKRSRILAEKMLEEAKSEHSKLKNEKQTLKRKKASATEIRKVDEKLSEAAGREESRKANLEDLNKQLEDAENSLTKKEKMRLHAKLLATREISDGARFSVNDTLKNRVLADPFKEFFTDPELGLVQQKDAQGKDVELPDLQRKQRKALDAAFKNVLTERSANASLTGHIGELGGKEGLAAAQMRQVLEQAEKAWDQVLDSDGFNEKNERNKSKAQKRAEFLREQIIQARRDIDQWETQAAEHRSEVIRLQNEIKQKKDELVVLKAEKKGSEVSDQEKQNITDLENIIYDLEKKLEKILSETVQDFKNARFQALLDEDYSRITGEQSLYQKSVKKAQEELTAKKVQLDNLRKELEKSEDSKEKKEETEASIGRLEEEIREALEDNIRYLDEKIGNKDFPRRKQAEENRK
ncbi:MAG: hypothetical protein KC649_02460, partial [Candidatus Omnitrophica bacterium]|nr:hypothetical protein [Candidatus Omnitrophota bacterium]